MNTKKLETVFNSEIKPQLGRIHKPKKYQNILWQLAENLSANTGRGLRESQLNEDVKPATQALNKLADKGFIQINLPKGDGTILIDPLNKRRELFNKQEMIQDYFDNLQRHISCNPAARQIMMDVLRLDSKRAIDEWLDTFGDKGEFDDYNAVISKLLENGIDLKTEGYGFLLWRRMAKYYRLSEKTRELLEVSK